MFPQNIQQGGGGPNTSSVVSQNTGLLGMPQIQAAANQPVPVNSTAPSSSTTNPQVANMIKALKG